jgi:protein TonB
VVIRVVAAADGRAASAELVSDPGHSFGAAAIACALRTRFSPARE